MAKVYEALTNNNIDYSYLSSQSDVDKMKLYNEGALQEMLGHWKGSVAFCTVNPGGYDNSPYDNYYKTIHINVFKKDGKYYTTIYSEFIENCDHVQVQIQGNYNILITGAEPYYNSTFSILFYNKKSSYDNSHIDRNNNEFEGKTAIDGDGINRYNGIGALVKLFEKNVTEEDIQKHLNLNSHANVFAFGGANQPDMHQTSQEAPLGNINTPKDTTTGEMRQKQKKPVLRYVLIIIGILLLMNFLSGLFLDKDGDALKEIRLSRDEIEAVETIDDLLSDFSHISESIEKEQVENVSQISVMLEQIDRRIDDASMIEYQDDWGITAYYSQISPDLEQLYEFINSNEGFIRDAVQITDASTGQDEILTRLMNLSIYGDNTNENQSTNESDAMIAMAEQLFLSEIRAYLSELKYHIDPILEIEVPEKYSEIIS